jgi:hypothetical protein
LRGSDRHFFNSLSFQIGEFRRSREAEHAVLSNALQSIEKSMINPRDTAAIIWERAISGFPDPVLESATGAQMLPTILEEDVWF